MLGARSLVAASLVAVLGAGLGGACGGGSGDPAGSSASSGTSGPGGGDGGPGLPTGLTGKVTNTRFMTADHMLASMEMQISGEPLAELLGRDLGGYDRFSAQTDNYTDPNTMKPGTDPLGFSLAVESYEYSKQPMNNLSFEAGAGLSLQFGPRLNPMGMDGAPAYTLLLDRLQYLAKVSRAAGAKI